MCVDYAENTFRLTDFDIEDKLNYFMTNLAKPFYINNMVFLVIDIELCSNL